MVNTTQFSRFDELAQAINDWRIRRKMADSLTALVRHQRQPEAEAALASYINLFPDEDLRHIVRNFSADRIVVTGWDKLLAGVKRRNAHVVAIAFSGHAFDYVGPTTFLRESAWRQQEHVGLECSYFCEPHPMAGDPQGLAEQLDEQGDVWIGDFDDIDSAMGIGGASPLLAAIRNAASRDDDADSRVMLVISEWWMMIHVHRAIARDLAQLDFTRSLPVLVTSHDFGDGFASFYEASGDAHPIEFEAARPKQSSEIYTDLFKTFGAWTSARSREEKRAKKEEKAYTDRDGEYSALINSLTSTYSAFKKHDLPKIMKESSELVVNFRNVYNKFKK